MNKKGITLIALIITIIVTLILVGVSVVVSMREDGLIAQAIKSKTKTEKAIALEEIMIETTISLDDDQNYSSDLLKLNLETKLGAEVQAKEDGTLRIKYKGYSFGVDLNGNVYVLENIDYSKLKVGDYVDYSPNTSLASYDKFGEQYSGSANNGSIGRDNNLRWRILNINENDNIVELISDGPTSTKVSFKGARGYNNGVALLNDYCNTMYSNQEQGATARSLNIEDIQNKMKKNTDGKKAYESFTRSNTNTTYKNSFKYTQYKWYPLKWKDDTSVEAESNPKNPEDSDIIEYAGEANARKKESDTNLTITQSLWVINAASMKTNFEQADTRDTAKSESMYYELLCNNGTSKYWLASRHTDTKYKEYACFGLRCVYEGTVTGIYLFYPTPIEGTNVDPIYIRPVVCLPADRINLNTEYNEETGWNLIDNKR